MLNILFSYLSVKSFYRFVASMIMIIFIFCPTAGLNRLKDRMLAARFDKRKSLRERNEGNGNPSLFTLSPFSPLMPEVLLKQN